MSGETFSQILQDFNTALERLRASSDAAERRNLLIILRQLLAEIDNIVEHQERICSD